MSCSLYWRPGESEAAFDGPAIGRELARVRGEQIVVCHRQHRSYGLGSGGETFLLNGEGAGRIDLYPVIATLPPLYPEWLGDRSFQETHGVRFAYAGGEMARGIASVELVCALARTGMLGFFGAAGLPLDRLDAELSRLRAALDPAGLAWGSNLIHSPGLPELEERTVDLYLRHGVRRVSASAFMALSPAVVRYACTGLRREAAGGVIRTNHVFAKVSRPEVARHFLSPPPAALLEQLRRDGLISDDEAALAASLPVAEDVTVEADSGGHTDNRPLTALFPTLAALRDELVAAHGYTRPIRVGAAGGLGTPEAVAAAYALGASYVMVGSVHQCTRESALSEEAKRMLAEAGIADVAMTAAADMFEAGVKVQVLKRGTLMSVRGNQLYQLYRRHSSLEDIPAKERQDLERTLFRAPLDEIWRQTQEFFRARDPSEVDRAAADPKHRMALVFRWYLGNSSRWPMRGDADRRADYQIWCGPAMGAFNAWVKGSFLEPLENRTVDQVALNLMEGAAVITRAHQLRSFGVPVPAEAFRYRPIPLRAA
ncbi:MAG TPA: PfaD family polyunsaturated fatty acid/polyketide biosynthesis protein [Opitutaceae bacterium]|jgi:PfaD family protein|nr:PfaD family polyunsaturated fatty acid/polyketide biosynthesis protein [Opitutaceae bacterium]